MGQEPKGPSFREGLMAFVFSFGLLVFWGARTVVFVLKGLAEELFREQSQPARKQGHQCAYII